MTACGSHVLDTSAQAQGDSHTWTGAGVAPTRNTACGSHILDISAQSGFGSHVVRGAGVAPTRNTAHSCRDSHTQNGGVAPTHPTPHHHPHGDTMTTPNHHTINALHELTHNITNDEFLADILYTEALTHQLFETTTPQPLPDTLSGDNLQLAINMCRNDFTDHAAAALTEWRNDNRINAKAVGA